MSTTPLEALCSKDEIRDTILRLCRGVDRCEVDLIRAAYHPDAREEHGYFCGSAWEFAATLVESKLRTADFMSHYIANILIELEGEDAATCESYFLAVQRAIGDPDAQIVAGRYVDRFERRQGAWKIARRIVVHDWSWSEDLRGREPSIPVHLFAQGSRNRSDPSYLEGVA